MQYSSGRADLWLRSVLTSPTLICLWMSSSPFLICGQRLLGTYILEQAEHFCPPYSNAERMVPVTTLSTSADVWTKWKFLPPHSTEGQDRECAGQDAALDNAWATWRYWKGFLAEMPCPLQTGTRHGQAMITHPLPHEGSSCRCPDSGPPASTSAWTFWGTNKRQWMA